MGDDARLWIVCERCGYMRLTPVDPGTEAPCPNCTSQAAWAFPTADSAHAYQREVFARVAESASQATFEARRLDQRG